MVRAGFICAIAVSASAAAAQSNSRYSPYLQQGLKRVNPITPAPDPLREYVTPQLVEPDKRSRKVPLPGIDRRREPKLLPHDGNIRLREQTGELPRVLDPQ